MDLSMVVALVVLLALASLHVFAVIRRHEPLDTDATLAMIAVVLSVIGLVEEIRARPR